MAKPGPHPTKFTLEQEQALALFFENRQPYPKIAESVGVSTRTIERWATDERFKARLEEMRTNLADSLAHQAYVDKTSRLIALSQMAEQARVEFETRTWLKEVRPTGKGEFITNEAFNEAAFTSFCRALDDIAKELGARKNVTELTGKDGGPAVAIYLPEKQLLALPEKEPLEAGGTNGSSES